MCVSQGAEAVRMYRLMLGPAAFSKGLQTWVNKYFGKVGAAGSGLRRIAYALPAPSKHWLIEVVSSLGLPVVDPRHQHSFCTHPVLLCAEQTPLPSQAASVEDFQKAMSAASPGALPPNWLSWYDQPGTPWVWVDPEYDSKTKTLKLQLDQGNAVVEDEDGYPGVTYTHLPIPIKVGALQQLQPHTGLHLEASTGARVAAGC